ncbi:MAG: hypothetical protein EOP07_13015 [Proteobacteria bacterium]|nr:MAG: hypothetical protein EOP07_13015 [Pseudomonadota bacterium]
MGIRIKHYTFSDTTALKEHLRAAEAQVDAMSDEELDQFEAEQQLIISSLVSPPRKSFRKNFVLISVVLMAALTLFVLKVQGDDNLNHWNPKGLTSSSVCEISVLQQDKRIVLDSSSGFVVQSMTKIYLFTNCKGPVTIQSLERGIWVDKGFAESEKGLLVDKEGYIDFRNYLGEELRLKVANGMSEEFSLVTRP